jgi:hypothetical protein
MACWRQAVAKLPIGKGREPGLLKWPIGFMIKDLQSGRGFVGLGVDEPGCLGIGVQFS